MTGDLVLIVLKIKLIVIGQLERKKERKIRVTVRKRLAAEMLPKGSSLGIQLLGNGRRGGTARSPPRSGSSLPLTSSPLGIRRLEMMMILSSLSNVTTSATQFGAQEWLMYLDGRTESASVTPGNTQKCH